MVSLQLGAEYGPQAFVAGGWFEGEADRCAHIPASL